MENREIKRLMKELENVITTYKEKNNKTNLIRLSENALESYIRHFNNKSIYIYIQGVISGRNTIHKAKCKYDIEKRFFNHIWHHKRR